jgi:hypothetical protein
MSRDAGLAHLDAYLAQVQRRVGGLPDAEVREIVAELRAHVLDKVGGDHTPASIEAAIAELGSPREIARVNITERIVARAEASRSPWSLLGGVVRLAGLSAYGAFAFIVSLLGYGLAGAFLLTALAKPFKGAHAGLWRIAGPDGDVSWSLGSTSNPQGQEVLGWWIIPIGLVAALVFGWLTYRFDLFSLRLLGRRARRRD